jgi:hypothetical protein
MNVWLTQEAWRTAARSHHRLNGIPVLTMIVASNSVSKYEDYCDGGEEEEGEGGDGETKIYPEECSTHRVVDYDVIASLDAPDDKGAGWRPPPEEGAAAGAAGATRRQGQGAGAPRARTNAGVVDPAATEAAGATGGATDTAEAANGDRTTQLSYPTVNSTSIGYQFY